MKEKGEWRRGQLREDEDDGEDLEDDIDHLGSLGTRCFVRWLTRIIL